MARLKKTYKDQVAPALQKQFTYANPHQIPRLEKIVLNYTSSEAIKNINSLESAMAELALITGQKAQMTRARKSIAGFKLRQGMPLGAKVTLRRERMWEFLDRLIAVSLPGTKDFRGLSPKGFDGRGNYTMGVKEQIIFPEIDYDKVDRIHGMDITFVTSAKNNEEGRALLKEMGMPFAKQ